MTTPEDVQQRAGDGHLAKGLAQDAAIHARPAAPTENSPVMGFAPECRPVTS